MTPAELSSAIKRGALTGAYLFYGEEDYLRNRYAELVRSAVLPDGDDGFNRYTFDADSFTQEALAEAITSLPVMADKKMIEITGLGLDAMDEDERKGLIGILSELPDYEYNVVVLNLSPEEFNPGTVKSPNKLLRPLSEVLTPVNFERQNPAKLNKWLGQHFMAQGVLAEPDVCVKLMDIAGHDMYTLASQSEKLAAYVLAHGRDKLTLEDVYAEASPVKEIDEFDFTNAILSGDTDRALWILADRKMRKEKPELILSEVTGVIRGTLLTCRLSDEGMSVKEISSRTGIHEYRVGLFAKFAKKKTAPELQKALALCYEADRKIKSTALDNYVLLDRLVLEIALSVEYGEDEDAL